MFVSQRQLLICEILFKRYNTFVTLQESIFFIEEYLNIKLVKLDLMGLSFPLTLTDLPQLALRLRNTAACLLMVTNQQPIIENKIKIINIIIIVIISN